MDTKERLSQNQQKMKGLQQRLQVLEAEKQEILQAILRTDGAIQVLQELVKEQD